MKKLFSVFTIIIILLSVTCVVLSYQNSSLNNQIGVLEDNLSECQNQTIQCENQISELENQKYELEKQNIELQNQNDQLIQLTKINNSSIAVRVTNFTISGMDSVVGVLFESDANITIQNLGTNDLEGLTLTMVYSGNDHPTASQLNQQSFKIESLNAGEERTVNTNVYWQPDVGVRVVISIKLDDTILHEYRTY